MKRIISYWVVVMLCFLTTNVRLFAQIVSISANVTHLTKDVVDYNGNKCVIEGGNAVYKIEVLGIDSIAEVISCNYIYNGTESDAQYTLKDGIIYINDFEQPNLRTNTGGNTFKLTLNYKDLSNPEGKEISGEACLVKVYSTPESNATGPGKNKFQLKNSNNLQWTFNGDGGYSWNYEWNCSDSTTGTSSTFTHSFVTAGEFEVTVVATNYAPDGTTVWGKYEKSWTINVYENADVNPLSEENTRYTREELFQDASWDLTFETIGGDPSGWSFEWKDEQGTLLSTNSSLRLTCERSADIIDKNITVVVKNDANQSNDRTDNWYKRTFYYYAKFYPCPIVKFSADYNSELMDGESENMSIDIRNDEGESLLEQGEWSIVWNVNDREVQTGENYEFKAENSNINNGKRYIVNAVISGTVEGIKKPYEGTLSHTYTVWTLPSLSYADENDSTQYGYGGLVKTFKAVGKGGKIDGWKYDWYHNGSKIKTTETGELPEELINNTDEPIEDDKYEVIARNLCHGNDFMENKEHTLAYNVYIFPKPYYPTNFTIIDLCKNKEVISRVRDGNHLCLLAEDCKGADPDGWNTIWKYSNDLVNNENYISINGNYSSMKKDCSKNVKISMDISNTFNGDSWINYYCDRELSIYARPVTPSSIAKKGDGTSGTAIATISVSDEDLKNREYWLVFGYMNGEDFVQVAEMEQKEAGTVRWASGYNSSNIDGILAVYSEWRYDDGARVTSGLCTSVGNDEDWDYSDFSAAGSRGDDPTSISEVGIDSSNQVMQIYDQAGRRITSMRKGMNIVRMYDGTTRKVYNK